MGRTSDARRRLIDAALELLSGRAYSTVGVAEISAHAGVQKGSFYYFFPSKEALALAVVDEHWQAQRSEWESVFDGEAPVTQRLRELVQVTADRQAATQAGTGSVTGCLFGNLALELSAQDSAMRERLRAIFDEQVAMIARLLEEGVAAGEIELHDVDDAARSIVAQLEGLVLFAKLFNDPTQLDRLWVNSLRLLGLPVSDSSTAVIA